MIFKLSIDCMLIKNNDIISFPSLFMNWTYGVFDLVLGLSELIDIIFFFSTYSFLDSKLFQMRYLSKFIS